MKDIDLEKINSSVVLGAKRVHFIGIGGVGISALARLMLHQEKEISGTNDSESRETLNGLRERGVSISLNLDPKNLPQADLYIYSDAWLTNNPQILAEAKTRSVPVLSYFEALGKVASEYYLIAVSGAHGKTTTTAMLADVLEDAGLDPTVVVGSIRVKTKSNFKAGRSKYFVVEADEYMRHFLNFTPKILVILNIDGDHLDYYKNIEDIESAFFELAHKIPEDGYLFLDKGSVHSEEVSRGVKCKVIDYSLYVEKDMQLKVPGEHNRKNAGAVLAVAEVLDIPKEKVDASLQNFSGTWRRFEYKGKTKEGALVYDDYAHHPSEVRATLLATRERFPDKKIILAFQPHLYSRTKLLCNDFAESLLCADKVILADIYAAREKKDESVSSKILAEEINKRGGGAQNISDFKQIEEELRKSSNREALIMTMGAGDIYKVGETLLS